LNRKIYYCNSIKTKKRPGFASIYLFKENNPSSPLDSTFAFDVYDFFCCLAPCLGAFFNFTLPNEHIRQYIFGRNSFS